MRLLSLINCILAFGISNACIAASTDFSTLELVMRDGMEEPAPDEGFGSIGTGCPRMIEFDGYQQRPAEAGGRIDFGLGYDEADKTSLTPGAQEIIDADGSGGSAVLSIAFAYEWMARCNGHMLLKTKEAIIYDVVGKIVDFTAELGTARFGVQVTRAVNFPLDVPIDLTTATALLVSKLSGLSSATDNVSDTDRWDKGILVILAPLDTSAANLVVALPGIDTATRSNHVVIIIVTDGGDGSIY